jgi:Mn2+/Fe2+ NRAMP family transporter
MSTATREPAEACEIRDSTSDQSNGLKGILKSLGPGLITGASDDDPSGIGTYAVAGASLGYSTLWTALVSYPMMVAVQYTCAKIGMVSGTGLAAVLRERFPRPLVYAAVFALVVANTIVPHLSFDAGYVSTLVAIFGTTISPYMFFWQPSEEVEEEIEHGRATIEQRKGATRSELKAAAVDTRVGMLFSNLIMYFIILATGATLFQAGQTHITSAADAAEALRPLAGDAAALLLALGLIGSGFLAVPVLTGSSAYAVADTVGWTSGLSRKPREARGFYGVIIAGTAFGMLFNFVGINPIDALFWTAVLNGFLAPPLLVLVMLVANDRGVMGARTNGRGLNVLGWGTTIVMFAAAVGLVVTWGQ